MTSYYSRDYTISNLKDEIFDLHKEKSELSFNQKKNIRIREKVSGFFQQQMQITSEEFYGIR